ncbi:MAG: IS200/IS605 family transposase [Candidatus Thermoplasmatota archaeon]|nr:IS200/IS605 family transposase [Euryarchaeota archaeon]MBU4031277.1 IS200/IS605 family transposase [Candidatus Thermoplasmatota archaeon]MBU4071648.1 IS200/IS605 family transposase [Candidatus Thermoplasmatota archaeon]MBU4143456.1 IS200/IS605 family transposase [Candidatus Thermoplasmatota archaeon]MBU4592646.1 IS200/IS605 family transposase [Candidatus Thermoplasmatota archaeon]
MQIVYDRHSAGGSNYHLQFTPKYRKSVFRMRPVRKLIEALMRRKAHQLGVRIEAIEFAPDHVHLFVTNCRRYSVSGLANHFKGYSSWYVRRALPEDVSLYLWGDSFWSDGYFYESIGRVTSDTVKFYIERQQGKHWMHIEPDALVKSPNQVSLHAFGI